MPGDSYSPSVATRFRKLAADQLVAAERFRELERAIRRCHPENMTPSEWAKLRVELLQLFRDSHSSGVERAALFDRIAEAFDGRRDSGSGNHHPLQDG